MSTIKKTKWLYRLLTLPFLITMLMAGIALLADVTVNVNGIVQLGYPVYICKILGTAKVLGCIAIVQNRSRSIKEWAYAGYTFDLLGAAASHAFSGDDFTQIITPVIILTLVLASYSVWKNVLTEQPDMALQQ